ncbi:MAG TPA: PilZ domain-containing protein [Nitrospirae bacterium]|nr:PilZ domain-containing protein [Nitrospirota bacterium]
MERRRSFRKKINMFANLLASGEHHAVHITNMSIKGVSVTTRPMSLLRSFNDEKLFQLKFKTLKGSSMDLQCRIKWSCKTPPVGITDHIGMEIVNPTAEYEAYFRTL